MKKIENNYISGCLLLILLVLGSCHASRKVTEKPRNYTFENMDWSSGKVLWAMKSRYIDYHTFSARLHIDYKSEDEQFNQVTTYLRMKKDSAIWLSVRPFLGIEMLRILITPDSIKLRNNLKGKTLVRSSKEFSDILHIPFDFSVIEALLIGNPTSIPKKIEGFKIDSNSISLSFLQGIVQCTYQWGKDKFLLKKSLYQEAIEDKSAQQQFSNYQKFPEGWVALERDIVVDNKDELKLHLSFDRIKFNTDIAFPFP